MQLRRTGGAALLLVSLTLHAGTLTAQRAGEPLPDNPFAIFDSYRLANGLKVWYGYLPGSTLTSMAVIVPAGWDLDAPGREQTAHFLEHVLLSDRHGRSEADLARELTARGGNHNGVTTPNRTHYPLNIGTDQAAFGVQWLADAIAPRVIEQSLVDRNREPVAIEINARARPLVERVADWYINHPRLRPPSFWQQEFGLPTQHDRMVDPYRTLGSITAADLQAYYDAYYAPAEMTFVIVTGAPRAVLQPVLDTTIGMLPWRPSVPRSTALRVRDGESRRFAWTASRSTTLRTIYRLPEFDARDHLRLIFIEDLLRHRLMERLRRGQDKLVYSVQAFTEMRGPAAYFGIAARIDPRFEKAARAIIEEEVARLRSAADDTAAFYADRDALSRRVRVQNAAPAALVSWATSRFYRPDLHPEFPDVGTYYAEVGPDSIAAFAQRIFAPSSRSMRLWRASPLPLAWVVALLAIAAFAGVRMYRAVALSRADMDRIRYVARLRPPLVARVIRAAGFAVLALAMGRLVFAAGQFGAERWIFSSDSMVLHALALIAAVMAATVVTFAAVGMVPVKVLVFDDEVRLKSRTYHARVIPAAGIRAVHLPRARAGLRLRQFWPAPVRDALFLELTDRTGYLLRTVDTDRLRRALERLLARARATDGDPADAHPADPADAHPADPADPADPTPAATGNAAAHPHEPPGRHVPVASIT